MLVNLPHRPALPLVNQVKLRGAINRSQVALSGSQYAPALVVGC